MKGNQTWCAATAEIMLLMWVCVAIMIPEETDGALLVRHGDVLGQEVSGATVSRALQKRSAEATHQVEVHKFHVTSSVTSRFAHTVMTSTAWNRANISQEIFFEVDLPKTAFITHFSMEIDGKTYVGEVKEKEKAKKQYDQAVSSGKTAGLVKVSGRKMERFSVSVNIAAESSVTFTLTHEELLQRKLGQYEVLTRVTPKQAIQDFQVIVDLFEPQGLTLVEASTTFLSNELLPLVEKTVTDTTAHISFSPTLEQQRTCPRCDGTIIDGDFIVKYDVKRVQSLGEVQVVNGYFVHFFAPPDLPRVAKNVVFVVDRSGSMRGQKIAQTRQALTTILKDLHEDDHFAIVTFDHTIKPWKSALSRATKSNVTAAVNFVKRLKQAGSTNINDAVLKAVDMLVEKRRASPGRSMDMVILMTDGMPNHGVSDPEAIQKNVREAMGGNMTLFSLGFGNSVDYTFLNVMSKQNKGLARRIFEASDAALQLQGFYEEVSSPLLSEVDLRYPEDAVQSLTKNHHDHLFNGSEIVVAGRLSGNSIDNFLVEIVAQGPEADFHEQGVASVSSLPDKDYIFGNYTERLWAYLTIRQLLENSEVGDEESKAKARAEALDMSLRYSFVTPLTSMVVTKPTTEDGPESPLVADKLTEQQRQRAESRAGSLPTLRRPVARSGVSKAKHSRSQAQFDVDGDPHFLVELPERDDALCFNVNGEPGDIFNLVSDPKSGLLVNGQVIKKNKASPDGQVSTYFGRFGVVHWRLGLKMEVTTLGVSLFWDGRWTPFEWCNVASFTEPNIELTLTQNCSLIVSLKHSVKFMIVRHTKVWRKRHQHQMYLGFYTLDSHHLSSQVHGLLGQFYHGVDFEVASVDGADTLYVKEQKLNVTRHWQKDFSKDVTQGEDVPCWFVAQEGKGLIDGSASDYILSDIFEPVKQQKQ
ncbi:inter-alpha-trypsin inhibitor heavy chain H3-like isoform X1 [Synchiropus splendidus]|uniref:inter-alpha-trypsin inhibitor heavy chain H3-like isoform X1 n=1 Tax=Synchiropus splendidus TaxID=270530 RepID=UPI00237D6D94|nr:inter-alpha-trypsin inhibitor heavy chain H3-like isoform X1 [Synchiropus splendidus]